MHLYQQLKSHFTIPNAFTNWEPYRSHLTQLLINETHKVDLPLSFSPQMNPDDCLPTLLILGAGECNDLDLSALLPHFSRITLLDADEVGMQQALSIYNLNGCSKIICHCTNMIGIQDEDYMEFCDELQFYLAEEKSALSPQSFAQHAVYLVKEQLDRHVNTNYLAGISADYVACFGVHSQILAMYSYIFHAFDITIRKGMFCSVNTSLCQEAEHTYMNFLKQQNDLIIPKLNSQILACAKQAAWFGLETKRLENEDSSAIEGAWQAYSDLQNRNLPMEQHSLLWPFYPEQRISYDMQLIRITPQK